MKFERPSEFLGGSRSPQYVKQKRSWKPKTNVDPSALPSMCAAATRTSPQRRNKPQTTSVPKPEPVATEAAQVPSMFQSAVKSSKPLSAPQQETMTTKSTAEAQLPSMFQYAVKSSKPLSACPSHRSPASIVASSSATRPEKSAQIKSEVASKKTEIVSEKKSRAERPPIELKYFPRDDEERSRERPALNIPGNIPKDIDADYVLQVLAIVNKESNDDLASISSVDTNQTSDSGLTGWDRIMKEKIDNFLGSSHSLPSNYCGDSDDSDSDSDDSDSDSDSDSDDDEYSF
jgi:hypothetical protein